ncbi:uncharacterized protein ISCGN_006814 [Ixodes scapularis]
MPRIGKIEEFDQKSESWSSYIERIEVFFSANDIPESKRADVLLSIVGREMYGLIRNLAAPAKPSTKTYVQIVQLVQNHIDPTPNETVERYKFHHRKQLESETIADYVAALKQLSLQCNFGVSLNDRLRDKLIDGIKDGNILENLLAEPTLTFKAAVDLATWMEVAMKDAMEIRSETEIQQDVNRLVRGRKHKTSLPKKASEEKGISRTSRTPCHRCGKTNHDPENCFARNKTCKKCVRTGHFQLDCRDRKRDPQDSRKKDKPNFTSHVTTQNSRDETPFYFIDSSYPKAITVTVEIRNKPLQMEIDTGSPVTVINLETFQEILPNIQLKPSGITLKPYTCKPIVPEGVVQVEMRYNGQVKRHEIQVVKNGGLPILGRAWLQDFRVNWKEVRNVRAETLTLAGVLQKHSSIFEGPGELKDYAVKLCVNDDAQPKFLRPRSVPFALRQKIEEELDRLEKEHIITPGMRSQWATPIVPVMKANGQVRICGDYKVTLNPALKPDRYPLPKTEDLFVKIAHGEKFTKLDSKQAYFQIPLAEESRDLTVINLHKGPYQVNRVPFGITPASAIFQRVIEELLGKLPYTGAFEDDIVVTGKNDQHHLRNLDIVLQKLKESGLHLGNEKCCFMQDSIEYLGHVVDKQGIHPNPKVNAVLQAKTPKDQKELRAFLGLLNYYGKFISNAADILHPLHELLRKDKRCEWSRKCQRAFNEAKKQLTKQSRLVHYDPALPLELHCDASSHGIGAVLQHVLPNKQRRPIAFMSRTLSKGAYYTEPVQHW